MKEQHGAGLELAERLHEGSSSATHCVRDMCMHTNGKKLECCWNPKMDVATSSPVLTGKKENFSCYYYPNPRSDTIKSVWLGMPPYSDFTSKKRTSEYACNKVNSAIVPPFGDRVVMKNPSFTRF